MAAYRLEVTSSAAREMDRLDRATGERVNAAIGNLAEDPRPRGCEKLAGRQDSYRVRVGAFRVLYQVNDRSRLVTVYAVGHRSRIYRKR